MHIFEPHCYGACRSYFANKGPPVLRTTLPREGVTINKMECSYNRVPNICLSSHFMIGVAILEQSKDCLLEHRQHGYECYEYQFPSFTVQQQILNNKDKWILLIVFLPSSWSLTNTICGISLQLPGNKSLSNTILGYYSSEQSSIVCSSVVVHKVELYHMFMYLIAYCPGAPDLYIGRLDSGPLRFVR